MRIFSWPGDVPGHPCPRKIWSEGRPAENAGVHAPGGLLVGGVWGRGVAAAAGRAGAGAGGGVRRRAVAGHGVHAPGRLHGRVRRGAVPAGPGHPAANPEGLPLRGLRRDLHGAAGHGPVEPVPGGGGRVLAGPAADPGGTRACAGLAVLGLRPMGTSQYAAMGRPGAAMGRRCGCCWPVRGPSLVAGRELLPSGRRRGVRPGGVVRLPESGWHVRGYLRLCPDHRRAVRLRGGDSVEVEDGSDHWRRVPGKVYLRARKIRPGGGGYLRPGGKRPRSCPVLCAPGGPDPAGGPSRRPCPLLLAAEVVISREIGSGVVPIDAGAGLAGAPRAAAAAAGGAGRSCIPDILRTDGGIEMKLTLLRHGETDGSRRDLYYGAADIPPCRNPWRRCTKTRRPIPGPPGTIPAACCGREQTLEAIYGPWAHPQLPGLREMDFGDFEMKSYQELKDTRGVSGVDHRRGAQRLPPTGKAPQVLERNRAAMAQVLAAGEDAVCVGPRRRHGGADDDLVRRWAVRLLREARHRVHGDVPGRGSPCPISRQKTKKEGFGFSLRRWKRRPIRQGGRGLRRPPI